MNKYKTLEVIGEGAYGIVLKCKNKRTGKIFAIKKFKDSEASGNSANRRELKLLRSLEHENIVKIEDAFIRKGKLCIVFEYMNKSLLQVIEEVKHGLPMEKIRSYSHQLCRAISYCHHKDIIHRDIKPENLLISENDDLKLCDFGFARNLMRPPDKLTEYVATRWYRSPELLLGGCYGKPVDIWSIGCIVGEMADGNALFPGNSEIDQLYLIQRMLGHLPPAMVKNFGKNQRFAGSNCPTSEVITSLERRYKGILSCCFIHFMKETLRLEPEHRLAADDCLKHAAFKFSLNCNSSCNSNKLPSTNKTTHNCVLPSVKMSDSNVDLRGTRHDNNIDKYKPRKLTSRVESRVLNDKIVKHSFTDAEIQSSDALNRFDKQIDVRDFFPNLLTESINSNNSIEDANESNDQNNDVHIKSMSRFKEYKSHASHKAISDPAVVCTVMKTNNFLFKLSRQNNRNLLDKQNVNCNHNGGFVNDGNILDGKLNSPISTFGLGVKQMEMSRKKRKFRKLNKVGVLQKHTNSPNRSLDRTICPNVTPNNSEMFEVADVKLNNVNFHILDQNLKVNKSCNAYSKSKFKLKPIRSNYCPLKNHTPTVIPTSSDSKIIKSSNHMIAGNGNFPGQNNIKATINSNMLPSVMKPKKRNSAIIKKIFGKNMFARVGKQSENVPVLTAVSCMSRIPVAVRTNREKTQEVLTFKCPKSQNAKKSLVKNSPKIIKGRQLA